MKKKTRKILFYSAVAIFFILSYLVVMFALGFRYDFVQKTFLKTGSFQVNSNVSAQVYINDKLAGSTSFLNNSFSKGRLLPRTYNVRLEAENRQIWQKLISVEAGKFNDFPRIVLLPKPGEFREVMVASSSLGGILKAEFLVKEKIVVLSNLKKQKEAINIENGKKVPVSLPSPAPDASENEDREENIDEAALSPDKEKRLIFNEHEIWVEWIKNAGYQPYKKSGEQELISRFPEIIRGAYWYFDSSHVFVDTGGTLKLVEIDDRDGVNIMDIAPVPGGFYYDFDSNLIYRMEGKNLIKTYLK